MFAECARPRILPLLTDLSLKTGSSLNLTCHTDCHHAALDWILNLNTGQNLVISTGPDLLIESLSFDYSGKLQCFAHLDRMDLLSDPVSLSVVGPPYIDTEEDITNMTTSVGDDLDIEVLFCSRPPASVSWVLTSGDSAGQRLLLSGRKHGRFSSDTRW